MLGSWSLDLKICFILNVYLHGSCIHTTYRKSSENANDSIQKVRSKLLLEWSEFVELQRNVHRYESISLNETAFNQFYFQEFLAFTSTESK